MWGAGPRRPLVRVDEDLEGYAAFVALSATVPLVVGALAVVGADLRDGVSVAAVPLQLLAALPGALVGTVVGSGRVERSLRASLRLAQPVFAPVLAAPPRARRLVAASAGILAALLAAASLVWTFATALFGAPFVGPALLAGLALGAAAAARGGAELVRSWQAANRTVVLHELGLRPGGPWTITAFDLGSPGWWTADPLELGATPASPRSPVPGGSLGVPPTLAEVLARPVTSPSAAPRRPAGQPVLPRTPPPPWPLTRWPEDLRPVPVPPHSAAAAAPTRPLVRATAQLWAEAAVRAGVGAVAAALLAVLAVTADGAWPLAVVFLLGPLLLVPPVAGAMGGGVAHRAAAGALCPAAAGAVEADGGWRARVARVRAPELVLLPLVAVLAVVATPVAVLAAGLLVAVCVLRVASLLVSALMWSSYERRWRVVVYREDRRWRGGMVAPPPTGLVGWYWAPAA